MAPKRKLVLVLSLLLIVGFLTTSLVSYYVSRSSLRHRIADYDLPLTSDNIYSEIQRDLLKPVFISSLMANDTFFKDWIIDGEQNLSEITQYLREIKNKYNTITSFFVSEKTRNYYYTDGILKQVKSNEERDLWYFRVQKMTEDYEINVDPDMANKDVMTIFINHKVFDFNGQYIGATGVGLAINSVTDLIENYREKYDRDIYFVDSTGKIILQSSSLTATVTNIYQMENISPIADQILSTPSNGFSYIRNGQVIHLNTRFVPELNWYLLVEQSEESAFKQIYNTLILNLVFCFLITAVVLLITNLTINAFQHKLKKMAIADAELKSLNRDQQEEIIKQHHELLKKNANLEQALAEVKQLSGFLPICSSCKKIRDDKGYWNQIESYIQARSEAQFSHGMCPDCMKKLYPDYYRDVENDKPEK